MNRKTTRFEVSRASERLRVQNLTVCPGSFVRWTIRTEPNDRSMGVDDGNDDDDEEENFDSDESMWSLPVRGDDASVSATRVSRTIDRWMQLEPNRQLD
jgi:hypothetical protein